MTDPSGNDLSFTGSAKDANAWLAGIQYQYTQNASEQKQTGDSYTITLTVTSYDDEGVAKTTTHTQRVDVAPQNDPVTVTPPANGAPHAIVPEDGSFNFGDAVSVGNGFTHEILGLSDPDNSAKQVIIKLVSIPDPKYGELVLTRGGQEIILTAGSTLSVAELGNLEYRTTGEQVSPANGAAATPLQNFAFIIDDGAGGRSDGDGGKGHMVNIQLTPVNQAPSVVGKVTIVEGESDVSLGKGGNLSATRPDGKESTTILTERGSLSGSDVDDSDLTYSITSLPEKGTLKYNGTVLTADNISTTVITDLDLLTYSYPSDQEPSDHGGKVSFGIQVRDSGGGAGADKALVTNSTVELTILENNDDPLLVHNEPQDYAALRDAGQTPDSSFTITEDMLSVSDEDTNNANLVFRVTGVTDPNLGYFTLNGKLLDAGTSFTMQDVVDGNVKYHLRTTSTDARTDSFTFEVVDSATGLIFGADGKAYQRDGGIYTDGSPGSALQSHTFEVRIPAAEPGKGGDLPALPPRADDLKTNDNPRLDGVLEGQGSAAGSGDGVKLTEDMLSTTDGVSSSDKIVYRLETLPSYGTLTLNGKVLSQFDSFTQKDIDDGNVKFQHQGGEKFKDEFQFSVSNGVKTSDGLKTFSITSIPQNDTPTASQGAGLNVLEGGSIVINSGGVQHIVLSDRDESSQAGGYANANELWFVVTKLPDHGELLLQQDDGTFKPLREGDKITQAQLDAGALTYKHGGSEKFTDSFSIQPYDNQNVGTGGADSKDTTPTNQSSIGQEVEIKITVAPDNDAPKNTHKQELVDTNNGTNTAKNGLYEGDNATIWGEDLTQANKDGKPFGQLVYEDSDNTDPEQIQYRITEASKYGQLILKQAGGGEVVLVKGSTFTQADLNAGRVEYRHNGGENHIDQFSYLVSDGDHSVNDNSDNDNRQPGDTFKETEASVFQIQVKPSNDKPSFVQKPSKPVVVDGVDSGLNKAPGFKVGDLDLPDTGAGGDIDLITVIVRVTDADGKPLADTDYTLKVTESTGLQGNSNTSATGSKDAAGYLVLTGSRDAVNKALASLEVGFGTDTNATYKLQVIADDRLNAAGNGYQNGQKPGDGAVTANGGDKNRQDKQSLQDIDTTHYDWASDVITNDSSFNLSVASVDLWVSITNDAPSIDKTPDPVTVYEDVPSKLTGFEFSDAESSAFGTWVEVTLEVTDGTLTTQGLPDDIEVVRDGTGSITLKGSVDAINAFLNIGQTGVGLFYASAANDSADKNGSDKAGDVTLTITLNEGASNIGTPQPDGSSSGDPSNGGSAIGGDTGKGSTAPNASVTATVAITVQAANDAPTASSSGDRVIITDPTTPENIDGFVIADPNDAGFESAGETDFIQVTVRLLDKDGNPLKSTDYAGVTLGIKDGADGIAFGGVNDVLVLRGTVEKVQAALAKLQITLDNSGPGEGLGNADNPYKIQIIADDRLRNPDGSLKLEDGKASANGGDKNNTGTGSSTSVDDINPVDIDVYSTTDFSDYAQNIATAERTIWPSSSNEAPVIGRTPSHVTVNEDERTFIGGGISVTDAESDQFGLPVQITIDIGDKGTLSVGGLDKLPSNSKIPGTEVTVVEGDGSGKLVLQGTASAISKLLNDETNGLFFTSNLNDNADHNGTDAETGQGDITVKLTVNEFESATAFDETPLEVTSAFYVTVNPVNDAPVLGGSPNNGTYHLYPDRVDGSNNGWHWTTSADDHDSGVDKPSHDPIKLISNATVTDVDLDAALNGTGANSFGGGSITVKMTDGYVPGDLLAVAQMAGIKEGGISGGNGSDLVIALSDTATAEQVKAILEAITFDNDGDPSEGGKQTTREYSVVLNDGNNNNGSANAGSGGAKDSNALTGTLTFQRYEAPVTVVDTAPDTVISGGTPTTTGNVLTNDTDKVLVGDAANTGKTGLTVTQVTGSSDPTAVTPGTTATTVQGTYGELTIQPDGSYTYTLDPTLPAYQALGGETVQESFSYRATDAQGLSADSTLTINVTGIDDPVTVVVNPGKPGTPGYIDHTVYESHLPDGSAATKDDAKLGVDSSFTVSAPDGLKEVTISFIQPDGEPDSITLSKSQLEALSTSNATTISTPNGNLVLTGYTVDENGTASVTYRYTLTDASSGASDSFTISAVDNKTGNNTGTGTIEIAIVDDAPVANADTDSIQEDATAPATGNVLDNDQSGADGWATTGSDADKKVAAVTGVQSGSSTTPPTTGIGEGVDGQYGTLTLNADGSYSYVLDNSNLAVQGLTADETLTETYTYTVTDADGNTTTATLTITIQGVNDGVTVQVPDTGAESLPAQPDGKTSDHVVFESGLSSGSDPNAKDTLVESSFTILALDGVGTVTIGFTQRDGTEGSKELSKQELEALATSQSQPIFTKYGELVLTGYEQAADGTITVSYTYTLTSAPHNQSASDNLVQETFKVSATDRDGDTTTLPASFSITIVDDAPTAEDDAATLDRKMDDASGNVIDNGGPGDATDSQGADGSELSGISMGGVKEYNNTTNAYDTEVPRDYTVTINGTDYLATEPLPSAIEPDADGKITITDKFGTLTIQKDGSYTYEALNDRSNALGIERTYHYTIVDGDGDSSTATLTIYVENRAPIITNNGVPVPKENGVLTPSGSVSESGLSNGSSDDKTVASTPGVITFTPGDGQSDIVLKSGDKTLTITNTDVITNGSHTLKTEHGTVTITSYDPIKGKLEYTYTLTSPVTGNHDAPGEDTFTVTVDGKYAGESDADRTASATVKIAILDDAPVANADTNSIKEDATASATGNVLSNDKSGGDGWATTGSDADKKVAAVTGVQPGTSTTQPTTGIGESVAGQYGKLTLNADGSYSYVLDNSNLTVQGLTADEALTETYTYTVTDADGDTTTATLTITIQGVNDGVTIKVPSTATDSATTPDQNTNDLVVFESGLPTGSATNNNDTVVNSTLELEALDGLKETNAITVTYTDRDGNPATLTLTREQVEALGTSPQTVTTENGQLTFKGYGKGENGIITLDYTYTLEEPSTTRDSTEAHDPFTVTATDRDGDTNQLTVSIKIVDDAPTAKNDTAETAVNTPISDSVASNDVLGADKNHTWTLQDSTKHGTVTLSADGSYTYTPDRDFIGTDTFTYTVTDADGDTSTATVTIEVKNTPPVATNDVHTTPPGGTASGNVITGGTDGVNPDTDADGHTLTVTEITVEGQTYLIPEDDYVLVHLPGKGVLKVESDGSYEFVPAPLWGGELPTIGYTITDGHDSSSATLTIHVQSVTPGSHVPYQPIWDTPIEFHGVQSFESGDALTRQDAYRDPSVYWEHLLDMRDMRLPELMHPITYVNTAVQASQDAQRQYDMQSQWGVWFKHQAQLSSMTPHLGMDPTVFVNMQVQQSQAEARFWNFLASQLQWNLPMEAPFSEGTLEAMSDAQANASTAETAQAQADALLARWAATADAPEASADAEASTAEQQASQSFQAQLLAQASTLPSHAVTP